MIYSGPVDYKVKMKKCLHGQKLELYEYAFNVLGLL